MPCPHRQKERPGGDDLVFLLTPAFAFAPMTIQCLMAACKIGKRLALVNQPVLSRVIDETHDLIDGVAGCAGQIEEAQTPCRVVASTHGVSA